MMYTYIDNLLCYVYNMIWLVYCIRFLRDFEGGRIMRNRFKYSDWKDMFGKKRDLEENMMCPEDVNATEHEDCYDCIKDGLYAGYVDWKRVFSNYTVEEIVNSVVDDDDIFDALLDLEIKKDVK